VLQGEERIGYSNDLDVTLITLDEVNDDLFFINKVPAEIFK